MTATQERTWKLRAEVAKYDPADIEVFTERRRAAPGLRGLCKRRLKVTNHRVRGTGHMAGWGEVCEIPKPIEIVTSLNNLLLNAGIARLEDLMIAAGGQAWDAAHSRIGVGNDATAAAATQTDLQAAAGAGNRQFKLCSSGPTRASQTLTWVATFASGEANFAWAEFCVDDQTEIMTSSGWRRYDEIAVGDLVLGMNPDTMIADWEPLSGVAIWPERARMMRHMEGGGHSSLTTLDHRWFTLERTGRRKSMIPHWRTSETLTTESRIPRVVPYLGAPSEQKYSDAFVQIVGWFWTEGWSRVRDRPSREGYIGQSHVVNPSKVAHIRGLLTREFGVGGFTERQKPQDGMTYFRLPHEAICAVLAVCEQDKAPTTDFLLSLTDAQLQLLVATCLDGDGHRGEQVTWTQTSEFGMRRFEMLCVLAGIPTNTTKGKPQRLGDPSFRATLLKRDVVRPVDSAHGSARLIDEIVEHEGLVWCPQTPSTTWLARRKGSIYWTGNCLDAGTADGTTVVATMLNRKVASNGTKASGAVWVFTMTLVIS